MKIYALSEKLQVSTRGSLKSKRQMSARSGIVRALIVAAAYFVILQSVDGAAIRHRRRKGSDTGDTSTNSTVSIKPFNVGVPPQLLPQANNQTSIKQLPQKNAVVAREDDKNKSRFHVETNRIVNRADRVQNKAAGNQIDADKTKFEKDQAKDNNVDSDSNDQLGAGDGLGEADNILNDPIKDKFWASLNKSRGQREKSAGKEPLILRDKLDENEGKKLQRELVRCVHLLTIRCRMNISRCFIVVMVHYSGIELDRYIGITRNRG